MINSLNVAQTGLAVAQVQVEGVMNNLANENTDGYKSRTVNVSELGHADSRMTGRGVLVDDVSRSTSIYMYQNLVTEQSKQTSLEELDVMLNDIESIFQETDDSGLSADINRYFQSLENLRTSPQNSIYKNDVTNNANILVEDLQSLYSDIESREESTLEKTEDTVLEINNILKSIGAVSKEIIDSVTPPNDLLDRRDALEKELATYIDVEISREDSYELKIGGATAVRFDTNVHALNLVETHSPQKDVYTTDHINGVSNLVSATWDAEGPDTVTYMLQNEFSVTVTHGEVIKDAAGNNIDLNGDGDTTNDAVTSSNIVRAMEYKINSEKVMLGKVTAYNGQYELADDGSKILTNNPLHSDYDILDPNKERYLVVEANVDGEAGAFVGEILVNDTEGAVVSRTHVEKEATLSKQGIDDIHLEIFEKEIVLKGGILKPMIDNIKTESGNNDFSVYKEKLDQFAIMLSDLSSGFIETGVDEYVYGMDASELHTDSDQKVNIGLFVGADVKSLEFQDSMVNTLTQEKLDYLATIQWKDDLDFDGTGMNNTSFARFYQTIRVEIADNRENVIFKKESQTAVTESLQTTYDKLTKVDKDKEMIELIKFQSAYEANAKMITVVDEMLQTLLGMKR